MNWCTTKELSRVTLTSVCSEDTIKSERRTVLEQWLLLSSSFSCVNITKLVEINFNKEDTKLICDNDDDDVDFALDYAKQHVSSNIDWISFNLKCERSKQEWSNKFSSWMMLGFFLDDVVKITRIIET